MHAASPVLFGATSMVTHHFIFMLTICSAAISPVYAPQPLKLQFWGAQKAPLVNFS